MRPRSRLVTMSCLALGLAACEGLPVADDELPVDHVDQSGAALTLQAPNLPLVISTPADDKSLRTPTGYWAYTGVTAAEIAAKLSEHDARLTNLDVTPDDPTRFTATMVRNAGDYAVSGWWWYPALTAGQLSAALDTHDARLIDVQKYDTAYGPRFAAVMVSNTGAAARSWWWYHDVTAAYLEDRLDVHGARLTSLKTRVVGGVIRHTAIMIENAGADAKAWWWYPDVSPGFVADKLSLHGARLVDIERRANGNLDVVMVKGTGEHWFWYPEVVGFDRVMDLLAQRAARPLEIERFTVAGQPRYAVVMIDNTNADTRNFERAMAASLDNIPGWTAAAYGGRVKRVGGAVNVSLRDSHVFDPASALKIVHATYALGTELDLIDAPGAFRYFTDPTQPTSTTVCPNTAWESDLNNAVNTTLRDGLARMMVNSDNRTTRGFERRYGRATLDAFMANIGMGSSDFDQFIGCGYRNGDRNATSARDLAHIYERIAAGNLLPADARTELYGIMLGGLIPTNGWIAGVIRDEAEAMGKSDAVADAFIAATVHRWKGGSYDICLDNGCTTYEHVRSQAGILGLPIKGQNQGGIYYGPTQRPVAYARYVTGLVIPCSPQGTNEPTPQMIGRCSAFGWATAAVSDGDRALIRGEVRAALATW